VSTQPDLDMAARERACVAACEGIEDPAALIQAARWIADLFNNEQLTAIGRNDRAIHALLKAINTNQENPCKS
jgi:hypothetical protein